MAYEKHGSNPGSVKTMVTIVAVVAIAVVLLIFLYLRPGEEASPLPATPVISESIPQTTPETTYQAPIPNAVYEAPKPAAPAEPLPSLNESDANVLASLQGLSTQTLKYAVPNEIIRKFVRAVNALEEGKVVHEYRPIVSPPPVFVAESTGSEDQPQFRLTANNFQRYDNYVALLAMLDTDQVIALYQRFYPLLEEAYAEMGLNKGNFHSVFIGAIDNLLAAPIYEEEILLVRPKVFYEYADPSFEKLPPSNKLLLRMGPENTRSLQESLRALRAKISQ